MAGLAVPAPPIKNVKTSYTCVYFKLREGVLVTTWIQEQINFIREIGDSEAYNQTFVIFQPVLLILFPYTSSSCMQSC